jgi:ATP synthase mitochondrial F1 complex assembly factor 2
MLDNRILKTPAKHPLIVPTKALALAIAAEWEWQVRKNI